MDVMYIGLAAALWGVLVLLVMGFEKLEKPQGGRS